MSAKRDDAIRRLKSVEDEFRAARFALDEAVIAAELDPLRAWAARVAPAQLRVAHANADVTYLVRLFAEFEGFLRSYWATIRKTEPPTRTLIDGVASRRKSIPADLHQQVQAVRQYRNDVVHGGLVTPQWTLGQCRSRLCRFLAHLPDDW